MSGLGERGRQLHCLDPDGDWPLEFAYRSVEGVARFTHVPPGNYEIRARVDGESKRMRIQMGDADQTVGMK